MSTALAVYHGEFGRATIYRLDRPLAPHAHREGHLVFLIGGDVSHITVSGQRVPLTQHLGAAVNPWDTHSFLPGDPDNGSLFLVLYIKPGWFIELGCNGATGLRFGDCLVELNEPINRLVNAVSALLLANDSRHDVFEGYLYELTHTCFERSWLGSSAESVPGTSWSRVWDFRIRNALRLMRDRVGEENGLDTIAREAGLSRPHFFKLFRENVGLTPNIYLNTLKMEMSIDRLTQTNEAITSIGLDLGFSSQASFTRFFTSNVGIPPTIYRKASIQTGI